jgi:hypothetical protein
MKLVLLYILLFIGILFIFVQFHEQSHVRIYQIMGCENITPNLFSVESNNCPQDNIKDINILTAELEGDYIHILGYSVITFLLILILILR